STMAVACSSGMDEAIGRTSLGRFVLVDLVPKLCLGMTLGEALLRGWYPRRGRNVPAQLGGAWHYSWSIIPPNLEHARSEFKQIPLDGVRCGAFRRRAFVRGTGRFRS